MKITVLACAVLVLVVGLVGTVSAADLGVAKSTLNAMGFASGQLMSDDDGMAIRGQGFNAWSNGFTKKVVHNGSDRNCVRNGFDKHVRNGFDKNCVRNGFDKNFGHKNFNNNHVAKVCFPSHNGNAGKVW